MYCRLGKLDEHEEGLMAHLKSSLINYAFVLRLKYKYRARCITDFTDIM